MHADPRLYRAFTIIGDAALVLGIVALLLGIFLPAGRLPWIISAGIAGLVVITARAAALRYR